MIVSTVEEEDYQNGHVTFDIQFMFSQAGVPICVILYFIVVVLVAPLQPTKR